MAEGPETVALGLTSQLVDEGEGFGPGPLELGLVGVHPFLDELQDLVAQLPHVVRHREHPHSSCSGQASIMAIVRSTRRGASSTKRVPLLRAKMPSMMPMLRQRPNTS